MKKGHIIAITNQKGGSAKTVTAVNLASCIAHIRKRKKVLLVDLDPQAHSTLHVGVNPYQLDCTIYHLLTQENESVEKAIVGTEIKNLDLLPSHIDLAGAEIELVGRWERESILKNCLEQIRGNYDYLFIDCPPSLGILCVNALTTADTLVIPFSADFFALEGTGKLMNTIKIIQKRLNPDLKIGNLVLTRYDARRKICKEILREAQNHFEGLLSKTIIRENVKITEAPSHGKPIILYSKNSNGCKDYMALAKEVLKYEK